MRVLLVQAYLGRRDDIGPIFPLGLSYIATALADHGHIVSLCDPNIAHDPGCAIAQAAAEAQPEVVGVSLRNIDTTDRQDWFYYYEHLDKTLDWIKRCASSAMLVIGGAGFSIFPTEIMHRNECLDFGVYQEGEESIVELLEHLHNPTEVPGIYYRDGRTLRFTGFRTQVRFPDLPPPRRDFANLGYYREPLSVGVQTKRGCVLRCAYCTYPTLNGCQLRMRPATDVVNEIESLSTDYGVTEVIFVDNVFDIPRSHAEDISHEMIRRKLPVTWSAWFHPQGLNQDFIDLVRQAGCYRMCLSPDAVSQRSLNALGKDLSEADVKRCVALARNNPHIDFRFSVFCRPPGQSIREILKTIWFIIETHVLIPNSKCLVSWIRVLPDTPIYKKAVDEGVMSSDVGDLLPQRGAAKEAIFYEPSSSPRWVTSLFLVLICLCKRARWICKAVGRLYRCGT